MMATADCRQTGMLREAVKSKTISETGECDMKGFRKWVTSCAVGALVILSVVANVTPSMGAAQIPGDCDNNGNVSISEVQSAIDMLLGLSAPKACVDVDNSSTVTLPEVQKVINAFLGIPTIKAFTATGSLVTGRIDQTETLLNDGTALIVGGEKAGTINTTLLSAELYNPATGSFAATGSLNSSRSFYSQTLLANGKVLIVGGLDYTASPPIYLNSAEIYDPATKTFSASAGSMVFGREGHSATLLPSGKVLIAGGVDSDGNTTGQAVLYDPVADSFTPSAGTMVSVRKEHSATLLQNGKVLIAGGEDNADATLNSAELYDPATDTFTAAGSMTSPRWGHTATLLTTGKVLIVAGGDAAGFLLSSAELFDPASGSFTATGSLNVLHDEYSATLLDDGTVLIAGGTGYVGSDFTGFKTSEVYNTVTGSFVTTGSLNVARTGHSATKLANGTVLIAGGGTGASDTPVNSAELY